MDFEKITLRRLMNDDNDYKLLEKWYQQKEIYLCFEQKQLSFDEVKDKYYPRTLDNAEVLGYIIEYNRNPIGIIQYKLIDEENKKLYELNVDNCFEIDIFIGELNYHNKGIGSRCVKLVSDYLFKEKKANLLVMCPLKSNINAIRCYQKCGFEVKKEFITEDTIGVLQKYVLMINSEL